MKKVIKMTPKRVAFVQAARESLGESTNLVDRADILTVVEKSGMSYPQWLVKGDTLKKSRGLFHLPNDRGEIGEDVTIQNSVPFTVATEVGVSIINPPISPF